ncbi:MULTISPECIES: sensor histidine kinase [Micromonospora]|uniref:histidine kinase n=1 Tax=Micromonospora solifontis TaxID=2487138 RepID=A0ABX9WCS8_9ACTN|nr:MULTISPECIES: sensor histidine kinase [Micromonospora]NES16905.1 sensor histidine kinase [Micromonospora sp. PPF5-17B]NES39040.1 sensor histidine kinase [Micromonospora solifontis]NES58619.1 sensor histidine kinase [Micromonospora sp. PPF5-6]RNL91750.1 sensor histidine kinase [Micromonospora solifontis]
MKRRAGPIRLPVLAQDVLLGLAVAVMQVQGSAAKPAEVGSRPLTDLGHLAYALLAASGLVLAVRRRWPASVFVTTALISLVYFAVGFPDGPGWIGLFVALYTLTAYGDGRRSLLIAGAGITVLATGWLIAAADIEPRAAIGWVFFRIAASVMATALGESVRSRRVIAAEALERARQAERTREEEARSRVDAERLRIAREVHDTVAHAIAIINVQAGVTAYLLDKRPERARDALVIIEQTSAQALHEMRAILGVLRSPGNGRVPHPGLGQIDQLTAVAREAGLDVNVEVNASTASLPSAVDTTAYRILQESITNVIRHVGPTRVTVALDYGADTLEIRVVDDGGRDDPGEDGTGPEVSAEHRVATGGSADPGRGIVGMRERCGLLGGELTAGPRPSGGFEVTARLPLAPPATVRS